MVFKTDEEFQKWLSEIFVVPRSKDHEYKLEITIDQGKRPELPEEK